MTYAGYATQEEWQAAMDKACPHGPDQPCTCDGCGACTGHEVGCTCDIDWETIYWLRQP